MLASLPYQYPQSQKRPLVVENSLYKNKKKKRQHNTTIFPSMTVNQSSPLISIDKHNQDIINPFTKNDIQMTDDIEMNNSTNIDTTTTTGLKYCERIENVDKYLSEEIKEKEDNNNDTKESDIYSVFYRQKPIVPAMINGTLLPMEKKQGENKLCIPDFVLRTTITTPSSIIDKMNSLMYNNNNNSNNLNNVFIYGNSDPMSMDID